MSARVHFKTVNVCEDVYIMSPRNMNSEDGLIASIVENKTTCIIK